MLDDNNRHIEITIGKNNMSAICNYVHQVNHLFDELKLRRYLKKTAIFKNVPASLGRNADFDVYAVFGVDSTLIAAEHSEYAGEDYPPFSGFFRLEYRTGRLISSGVFEGDSIKLAIDEDSNMLEFCKDLSVIAYKPNSFTATKILTDPNEVNQKLAAFEKTSDNLTNRINFALPNNNNKLKRLCELGFDAKCHFIDKDLMQSANVLYYDPFYPTHQIMPLNLKVPYNSTERFFDRNNIQSSEDFDIVFISSNLLNGTYKDNFKGISPRQLQNNNCVVVVNCDSDGIIKKPNPHEPWAKQYEAYSVNDKHFSGDIKQLRDFLHDYLIERKNYKTPSQTRDLLNNSSNNTQTPPAPTNYQR
ncbi:MAG: hypothetical protein LBM38_02370 [Clostridiales bacterium]|jgi:hypothetical protein|nr:hypothetical protein [Clostridiales bacterium]